MARTAQYHGQQDDFNHTILALLSPTLVNLRNSRRGLFQKLTMKVSIFTLMRYAREIKTALAKKIYPKA